MYQDSFFGLFAESLLGELFRRQGKLSLAREYFDRSLEPLRSFMGEKSPHYAEFVIGRGALCLQEGDFSRAVDVLKAAQESLLAAFGAEHPVAGMCAQVLSMASGALSASLETSVASESDI